VPASDPAALQQLFTQHSRRWQDFRYVYPVISRRSHGLSIGINLNPDGLCNFDCVYCCVNRPALRAHPDPAAQAPFDLDVLRQELDTLLAMALAGDLWRMPPFDQTPPDYRRVCDIAFSGNGEPTACQRFADAVRLVAQVKHLRQAQDVSIVLITNATLLHRPAVQEGLAVLYANQGEIWAKLDAGTQGYYQRIDRSTVPLRQVTTNITEAGREHPLVIQSMFITYHGRTISDSELKAYTDRLARIVHGGCQVKLIQVYTLARATTDPQVQPTDTARLEVIAATLRTALPAIPVEIFPAAT
jgi:wyosine [tRNA(Phe)-imidazoG37] synthetase (radical SAM superfamily)